MPEYIEREAVVARIKQTFCSDCDSYNGVMCRACLLDDTLLQIEDEPAADVAPVVHGEWERILCDEDAYEHHRCSICKDYARFSYFDETVFDENSDGEMEECGTVIVDIIEELTPFCPLCGAKMDGGEK